MKKIFLLISLIFVFGCSNFEPQLTTQSVYYKDSAVQLSQLMVYTYPKNPTRKPLSALFYPFHVTQQVNDSRNWGKLITETMWKNWTSMEIFPSMVYDENLAYRGLEEALFTARSRGYDLLVVGFVPYLYLGHTMDDSAVTVQVKIYETKRGKLVCSFEQSGRIAKRMDDDFVIVKRTYRMPDSALYKILHEISEDMAVPLVSWARYTNNSEQMIKELTPPMANFTPAKQQIEPKQVPSKPKMKPYMPPTNEPAQKTNEPVQKINEPQEENIAPSQEASTKLQSINLAVKFDSGSSTISKDSYPLLNELAKALTNDNLKDKKIMITGHTDGDADSEYNKKLSLKRADAVKKFLTANYQISPERIYTEGKGETEPLVPNTSKYNKLLNRRVQISVIK